MKFDISRKWCQEHLNDEKGFNVSAGYVVNDYHTKKVWCATWYMPWTWFSFKQVTIIDSFDLRDISIVKEEL